MLDLGVGGGRTTVHFAKWAHEYIGADYSENMIAECRRRFSTSPRHISFVVCDARWMDMFESGSFDFILFSFNGIDYVTHSDRLRILKEIRRIGKPGGWFCFSSHNLNSCAELFELKRMVSFNPSLAKRTVKRLVLRFVYNWSVPTEKVMCSPYITINDGSHGRNLRTYYIRPEEQLAQLSEGFTDVQVFSLATGAAIDRSQLRTVEDGWLYYLCRIR